jgi:3-phenylpropionate/trans-cinnamate dioxygenase ferredoxin component
MTSLQTFVRAAAVADIPESGTVAVEAFGRSILICNSNGNFYAIDNECSHQRRSMVGGRIRGVFLFCPVHGARYDLRTGIPSGELTRIPLRTYPARVRDGWIEISDVPGTAPDRPDVTLKSPGRLTGD